MSDITTLTEQISKSLVATVLADLQERIIEQVVQRVNERIEQSNIQDFIRDVVRQNVANMPLLMGDSRIPGHLVDTTTLTVSADRIDGGSISKFKSSGIIDSSSSPQLELKDGTVVISNNLRAPNIDASELRVRGTTILDGSIVITGTVAENTPFFSQLVESAKTTVMEQIDLAGLSVSKLSLGGKEVLTSRALGTSVTDSNLQKLGLLKELQVRGESLLGETLYVSAGRVGINTIEPSTALSIWDEEVELVAAKMKSNTGWIGTLRSQEVVLTSNRKQNLTLHTDGSVTISELRIDGTKITSGSLPNSHGEVGQIVLNKTPVIGAPVGWVCLGGTKWAPFASIQA